jgi:anti-sigma28 factor (negative regulator of flagellin synthesis)
VSVEVAAAPAAREVDSVSLSEHARLLDTLKNSDGVRRDVVDRVRGEIESGTYDISDEKLDKVVDGLMRDLFA